MAHARVYNDYVVERFSPYFDRLAPTAPIPLTDVGDAVAEIERVAAAGFRAILLPATPPRSYYTRDLDPVWAAAQASGVQPFFHTQTGGVKVNDTEAITLKVVLENAAQVNQPMTEKAAAKRMVTQAVMQHDRPAAAHLPAHRRRRARALPRPPLLAHRVQRPLAVVARRRAWTSAGSPASARTPTGGSASGTTPARPTTSPNMAQLFKLNEKWPYPLTPSEYVQRQFHVQFQDDPVAVACRHITGLSTHRVGQRLPARRGHVPRQPGAASPRSSPACPTTSARPSSAAPSAASSASTASRPERSDRAPLRRARRRRHRRRARHRPRLRLPARRRGAPASWSTTSAARWRATAPTPGRPPTWSPRSWPPAARPSPTPTTCATPRRRQALVDARRRALRPHRHRWSTTPGIMRWAGFPDVDADNLDAHLAVHVGGSFHTARAAWPHLVEQGYGRIVMTTSTGVFGLPANLSYATAKGGVIGHDPQPGHRRRASTASRSTASPPRPPPGWAAQRTDGPPTMAPELVAPMVAFLAHEDCPVTGEIYVAGAGRFARLFLATTAGLRRTTARRRRSRTSPPTGRRSTTRPATTSPPTSWPGRGSSRSTCAEARSEARRPTDRGRSRRRDPRRAARRGGRRDHRRDPRGLARAPGGVLPRPGPRHDQFLAFARRIGEPARYPFVPGLEGTPTSSP